MTRLEVRNEFAHAITAVSDELFNKKLIPVSSVMSLWLSLFPVLCS